jgi:hypothetical protein
MYAANGVPPIHHAHGMPPIHIHGSEPTRPTLSISYTTYASTYYTIYTSIGYGHCRPTRMQWRHNIRPTHLFMPVPMVCRQWYAAHPYS